MIKLGLQDKFSLVIALAICIVVGAIFYINLNLIAAWSFYDKFCLYFLIGLVVALVLGRVGGRLISKPVNSILLGMQNIEAGNYGYKVNIISKDEIGALAQGFDRMSERLGDMERLKSGFLSIVSHELITPLTPIRDSVAQLKADPSLSETAKDLVDIIIRQVGRLQELVDDVLDLSLIELQEWKLKKEVVDLEKLCRKKIEEYNLKAQLKKVELELMVKGKLPRINLDRRRIGHVLKILLDNALKFTPEGGKIMLKLYQISGGVEVAVEDTGMGLSKETLEKIFDSFYQVEDHLTRTKGGTGIGLTIAKRLVEAHKGYIWVESAGIGQGSRFIFLLPES
jgi:signal transduction histidine kinase